MGKYKYKFTDRVIWNGIKCRIVIFNNEPSNLKSNQIYVFDGSLTHVTNKDNVEVDKQYYRELRLNKLLEPVKN